MTVCKGKLQGSLSWEASLLQLIRLRIKKDRISLVSETNNKMLAMRCDEKGNESLRKQPIR